MGHVLAGGASSTASTTELFATRVDPGRRYHAVPEPVGGVLHHHQALAWPRWTVTTMTAGLPAPATGSPASAAADATPLLPEQWQFYGKPVRAVTRARRAVLLDWHPVGRPGKVLRALVRACAWGWFDMNLVGHSAHGSVARRKWGHQALFDSGIGAWSCVACGASSELGDWVAPDDVRCARLPEYRLPGR